MVTLQWKTDEFYVNQPDICDRTYTVFNSYLILCLWRRERNTNRCTIYLCHVLFNHLPELHSTFIYHGCKIREILNVR